ncbi:MAG: hypothetical protein ACKV2O_06925 [Acidimicrobiales bacterium]
MSPPHIATTDRTELADNVARAVAAVTDPEYPDVTIAELGMLERVVLLEDDHGGEDHASCDPSHGVSDAGNEGASAGPLHVRVELVPTVLGCPALRMIEADVRAAALHAGATTVEVNFLLQPVWSPDRIAAPARERLAREYTITLRGRDGSLRCPLCGSAEVSEKSAIGPARCRAVYYCDACRNPVEVLRR